jgi:hypothetical protein
MGIPALREGGYTLGEEALHQEQNQQELDPYIINMIEEVSRRLEISIAEVEQIALDAKSRGKNPYAVLLGKLGASKGGRNRAENLSNDDKKEIAWMGAMTVKKNKGTITEEDRELLKKLKIKYKKK